LPRGDQIKGIQDGALWPFVRETKLYECPTGFRGEMLTYAMMISSNGRSVDGSPQFKLRLKYPDPAHRLVFIDEGLASPDAYATKYLLPQWWDQPVTRHGDGTNFAFVDGHCEYHKWRGAETVRQGRHNERRWVGDFYPVSEEGIEDVQWVQRGTWGKLGYTP
jgi:prepilin-type processing-associated H-X9-DG protein